MGSVKNTLRAARLLSWQTVEQGGPVAFTAEAMGEVL